MRLTRRNCSNITFHTVRLFLWQRPQKSVTQPAVRLIFEQHSERKIPDTIYKLFLNISFCVSLIFIAFYSFFIPSVLPLKPCEYAVPDTFLPDWSARCQTVPWQSGLCGQRRKILRYTPAQSGCTKASKYLPEAAAPQRAAVQTGGYG